MTATPASKDVYITFSGLFGPLNAEALRREVLARVAKGYTHVHLMLNTPGGDVSTGLAMGALLRMLPVQVTTYNLSNVDSIGVPLFMAGSKRFATARSSFFFHRTGQQIQAQLVDTVALQRELGQHVASETKVAGFVADRANPAAGSSVFGHPENVAQLMIQQVTITPEQALELGVATDLLDDGFKIPTGAEMVDIPLCPPTPVEPSAPPAAPAPATPAP